MEASEHLTAEIKKKYNKLFNNAIDQLMEQNYLSIVESYHEKLVTMNGLKLTMNGTPVEVISLYKKGPIDKTKTGTLQYTGRTACDYVSMMQKCVVLKYIEPAIGEGELKDSVNVTTLIVDPDSLRIYSKSKIPVNEENSILGDENIVMLATSKRSFFNNKPNEKDLERAVYDIAHALGYGTQTEASFAEFSQAYREEIKALSSGTRYCKPHKISADNFTCKRLFELFQSDEKVRMFSYFESLANQEKSINEGDKKLLKNINEILLFRVMAMAGLEVAEYVRGGPELSQEEIMRLYSEHAQPFIENSPITSDRHQRYLAKLKDFLDEAPGRLEAGERLDFPKR